MFGFNMVGKIQESQSHNMLDAVIDNIGDQ